MMKKVFLFACMLLISRTFGWSAGIPESNIDKLIPVQLNGVKVRGEIGRRMDITVNNNLLKIDIDNDFLSSFQNRKPGNNYIGLGKLIDTVVKMAANSGDDKLMKMKDHLINAVIGAQESDGYIGNMIPENRIIKLWDIHEMGYIIYGLISDYQYFGSIRSLEAAKKASDYILEKWSLIPTNWETETHVATHVGITGIHRTFLTLYRMTGDQKYLDFLQKEQNLAKWNPDIVIGRKDLIEGHIYGYMASSLAQLELYRIMKDDKLLVPTRKSVDFLTKGNGMTITGGAGQVEIWTADQDGRGDLGETCASAYQIRLFESMLRLTSDARYGDLMERIIYNALFGAQSPDGRKIRYFTPFEGPRVYHNTDTYCCPCNYRRIVADLPSMIFYKTEKGVAVNLYSSSDTEIQIDRIPVKISQETDYPNAGQVVIHIDPSKPVSFPVLLRIPLWCKNPSVSVNGKSVPVQITNGHFATVNSEWKPGDQIMLSMPMDWRLVKGRQQQAGKVAVMRGPLLFCLNPAQNPLLSGKDGSDLGKLTIDLASMETQPVRDASVRPDGIGCRLKAGNSQWAMGNAANLTLTLTEFADPDGKCTFFRTPELAVAVDDELYNPWK